MSLHDSIVLFTDIISLLVLSAAIDECSTIVADCDSEAGAVCINTGEGPGFLCQCPPGYTGDGRNSGSGCTGESYNVHVGIYDCCLSMFSTTTKFA